MEFTQRLILTTAFDGILGNTQCRFLFIGKVHFKKKEITLFFLA